MCILTLSLNIKVLAKANTDIVAIQRWLWTAIASFGKHQK